MAPNHLLVFVAMRLLFHHAAPNVACENKTQKCQSKAPFCFFYHLIHHTYYVHGTRPCSSPSFSSGVGPNPGN